MDFLFSNLICIVSIVSDMFYSAILPNHGVATRLSWTVHRLDAWWRPALFEKRAELRDSKLVGREPRELVWES